MSRICERHVPVTLRHVTPIEDGQVGIGLDTGREVIRVRMSVAEVEKLKTTVDQYQELVEPDCGTAAVTRTMPTHQTSV